jgi:GNAT superfamily N-acetyltransferase
VVYPCNTSTNPHRINLIPEDFLFFFDQVAFTDNPEWKGCYCVFYHWNDELAAECKEYSAAGGTCFRRELAVKFIREGILQGYLAYTDGKAVGWCNANDKTGFDSLAKEKRPELWDAADHSEKIKSIVCFTIAPDRRGRGIATALLNRVCEDAFSEGYSCVEAYPGTAGTTVRSYHGPSAMYEKCGFSVYKNLISEAIVRKYPKA